MTFSKKMAVLLLPLMIAACGGEEQAENGAADGASETANESANNSGESTGAVPASPSGEPWNAEQQDAYIQCLQQNRIVAMAWDAIEKKCVDQINRVSQQLPE